MADATEGLLAEAREVVKQGAGTGLVEVMALEDTLKQIESGDLDVMPGRWGALRDLTEAARKAIANPPRRPR